MCRSDAAGGCRKVLSCRRCALHIPDIGCLPCHSRSEVTMRLNKTKDGSEYQHDCLFGTMPMQQATGGCSGFPCIPGQHHRLQEKHSRLASTHAAGARASLLLNSNGDFSRLVPAQMQDKIQLHPAFAGSITQP